MRFKVIFFIFNLVATKNLVAASPNEIECLLETYSKSVQGLIKRLPADEPAHKVEKYSRRVFRSVLEQSTAQVDRYLEIPVEFFSEKQVLELKRLRDLIQESPSFSYHSLKKKIDQKLQRIRFYRKREKGCPHPDLEAVIGSVSESESKNRVYAYNPKRKKEFTSWLYNLPKDKRKVVLNRLDEFIASGNLTSIKAVRSFQDTILEMKFQMNGGTPRIYFFKNKDGDLIITGFFLKKSSGKQEKQKIIDAIQNRSRIREQISGT